MVKVYPANLIRFERAQYAEVVAKWNSDDPEWEGKKTASDTYGAEHLMRLIGELETLITYLIKSKQTRANFVFPYSLPSGTCCPDQHGSAVCQPPTRGDDQDHELAVQERRELLPLRLREPELRVYREGQELGV